MKDKHLNIVSFNVPYPANYGGVIDVFYKIKALEKYGVKIHLHCFKYGRKESKKLEKICETVNYYDRNMNWKNFISKIPFIVKSRTVKQLLKNLIQIDAPILFEGLHSCAFLNHPDLRNKKQFVRTHNIEMNYYKLLFKHERKIIHKIYLYFEYLKIKSFEKKINEAQHIFSISPKDQNHFSRLGRSSYIKAFHQDEKVTSNLGLGDYAIYHGNLTVSENESSALFLIQKIFSQLKFPLIIAGYKPSKKIITKANKYKHIKVIDSPKEENMNKLIENAQIQLLPSMQDTGIKLKLLKSLFKGRHCIANKNTIYKTGLEHTCHNAENTNDWILKIKELKKLPFTKEDYDKRSKYLKEFDSKIETQKIINIIYPQNE